MRHGATGVRCEACISPSPRARGLATRAQLGRGAMAAFAVALVGGGLMGWLSLVHFFTALVFGFMVGAAAFIAAQRHRDAAVQGLAGAAALIGIMLAAVLGAVLGEGDPARALLAISFAEYLLPAISAMAGAILRFML